MGRAAAEGRAAARLDAGAISRLPLLAPSHHHCARLRSPSLTVARLLSLASVQNEMLGRATKARDAAVVTVTEWKDFVPALQEGKLALTPFVVGTEFETEYEELVKDKSKAEALAASGEAEDEKCATPVAAKTLCIPFEQVMRVACSHAHPMRACSMCIASRVLHAHPLRAAAAARGHPVLHQRQARDRLVPLGPLLLRAWGRRAGGESPVRWRGGKPVGELRAC